MLRPRGCRSRYHASCSFLTGVLLAASFPHLGHPALCVDRAGRRCWWHFRDAGPDRACRLFAVRMWSLVWCTLPARSTGSHAVMVGVRRAPGGSVLARCIGAAGQPTSHCFRPRRSPWLMWVLVGRRLGDAGGALVAPAVWVTSELAPHLPVFTGFPMGAARVQSGPRVVRWPSWRAWSGVLGPLGAAGGGQRDAGRLLVRRCAPVRAPVEPPGHHRRAWSLVCHGLWVGCAYGSRATWLDREMACRSAWSRPFRATLPRTRNGTRRSRDTHSSTNILTLTHRAVDRRTSRLVVWPEAATPFAFETRPHAGERIRQLAAGAAESTSCFGTTDIVSEPMSAGLVEYYNCRGRSSTPSGDTVGYLPQAAPRAVRRVCAAPPTCLTFVSPLVENVGGFSAGMASGDVDDRGWAGDCHRGLLRDHLPGIGTSIRNRGGSRAAHDGDERRLVRSDGRAVTSIFSMATMRAIEQGRYLVQGREYRDQRGRSIPTVASIAQHGAVRGRVCWSVNVRLIDDLTPSPDMRDLLAFGAGLVCDVSTVAGPGGDRSRGQSVLTWARGRDGRVAPGRYRSRPTASGERSRGRWISKNTHSTLPRSRQTGGRPARAIFDAASPAEEEISAARGSRRQPPTSGMTPTRPSGCCSAGGGCRRTTSSPARCNSAATTSRC